MRSSSTYGMIRNLLLTIAFDGTGFHGWQVQKNALSVQEVFQKTLERIIGYIPDIKGCSRTDSGVHANMYCISMKIDHPIPTDRLKPALNRFLPKNIVVLDVREVDMDFHARYSAKGKEYIYKVWNAKERNPFLEAYSVYHRYDFDMEKVNRNAQDLVGYHDFSSFCTKDRRDEGDLCRTVRYFEIEKDDDLVLFRVAADGFLYNMVRIMVGTLLEINTGYLKDGCINEILEAKDRRFAGPTVPARGLFLNRVFYEDF